MKSLILNGDIGMISQCLENILLHYSKGVKHVSVSSGVQVMVIQPPRLELLRPGGQQQPSTQLQNITTLAVVYDLPKGELIDLEKILPTEMLEMYKQQLSIQKGQQVN